MSLLMIEDQYTFFFFFYINYSFKQAIGITLNHHYFKIQSCIKGLKLFSDLKRV